MTATLEQVLDRMEPGAVLRVLTDMLHDMTQGADPTLAAFAERAKEVGAKPIVVGGVAVIAHGYRRTTDDRDVLVHYREKKRLADNLWGHPDWERLEIREFCFVYKPTGIHVDFLISSDLMTLGRPYLFPDAHTVETKGEIEGLPIIGLHDLLWLKLMAGRRQDEADMMELCKRHLGEIDPQRVIGHLEPEDDDLRERFMKILADAPIELEGERRLGQDHPDS
jgi:hypothetical protein